MSQLAVPRSNRIGVFLGSDAGRRAAMAATCADLIDTVQLADDAAQALAMVTQRQPDLLVIDLDGFTRELDLAAMGRLVTLRDGAATLLVCPRDRAEWLGALMACGPCEYALAPVTLEGLHEQVGAILKGQRPSLEQQGASMRELLALRSSALRALAEGEGMDLIAASLATALAGWRGVVHAAVFAFDERGVLRLQGQAGSAGIDLAPLLAGEIEDAMADKTRRPAFPALAAARGGELVIVDATDDIDGGALLQGHAAGTVVGVPIPATGPGEPLGALSLVFDSPRHLSSDELTALNDIAQGTWLGLRLAEMNHESEQLMAQVTRSSTIDALTGVANRRHGEALLEKELRRARRYQLPLALLAFDIDRFKGINERYGHPCGDMALRTVASAAQSVLRGTDMLVRAGGEEFLIIATHTSAIDGLKLAEKIRSTIEQTPIPGCDRLTVSLGVAQLGGEESADTLTVRVNAAMGRAKRAGRNCVELAMQ